MPHSFQLRLLGRQIILLLEFQDTLLGLLRNTF